MNCKKTITILAIIIGIQKIALSQNKTITLDQAVQLGLENSKALHYSKAKTDVFDIKIQQAKNLLLPNVNIGTSYTRISNNITPFTMPFNGQEIVLNPQILNQITNRASLQYAIFNGFKAKQSIENVELMSKMAQLDYEKDKIEIKNTIVNAYYNLCKAIQSKQVIIENINNAKKRIEDITHLKNNGMALDNDVMKVVLQQSNFELANEEIASTIKTLNFNLNIILGLPDETVITPSPDEPDVAINNLETNNAINTAVQNRIEFKTLSLKDKTLQNGLHIAKSNYYPTVSINANAYYNDPNQRVFPPVDKFKGGWDAGINANWNLTQLYTNKKIMDEANQNIAIQKLNTTQLTDNIKMEVNANMEAFKLCINKINLTNKSKEQAVENLRITNNQYKNQIKLITDVLDADLILLQSNINIINAQTDAKIAYQKLLKSIGQ